MTPLGIQNLNSLSLYSLHLPGGFLRMKVQSLCLVSSMPLYPQALQEFPMVCFLGLMCYNDKNIWSNFKVQ